MVDNFVIVDPPRVTPWRYGLFSAANVITSAALVGSPADRAPFAGIEYQTDNCAKADGWPGACAPPMPSQLRTATIFLTGVRTGTTPNFLYKVQGAFTVTGPTPSRQMSFKLGTAPAVTVTGGLAGIDITPTQATPWSGNLVVTDVTTGASTTIAVTQDAAGVITPASTPFVFADPPPNKAGVEPTLITATPFVIWAGSGCAGMGMIEQAEERARLRLALAEPRRVEQALELGDLGNRPRLADPSTPTVSGDLTTAYSLKRGIGALEAVIAAGYGGVGTIHSPRWVMPYMADKWLLIQDGPNVRTQLGTLLAFGGGYSGYGPDGNAPTGSKVWLYATGQVTVRRSEVIVPAVPPEAFNWRRNRVDVIAERAYVVDFDCFVYAVLVDLSLES